MPPIWKIKNKPFWLTGTIHSLKKEDYPIPAILQKVIEDVTLLVLEDKDFLSKGQNIGLYEKGKTIHSELSSEAIDLLLERCKDVNLNFNEIQTFRPWKAAITVAAKLWESIGFFANQGLDKYLLDIFLSSKKQVISLEDSSDVLLILEHLSSGDQERMLVDTIKNVESITQGVEGLHEAWKLGSEELMIKFAHEPLKIIPGLFQQLIVERNAAWLPKITKLINEQDSVLVAVGTAHLFGESNVIDSLVSAGYEAKRLT